MTPHEVNKALREQRITVLCFAVCQTLPDHEIKATLFDEGQQVGIIVGRPDRKRRYAERWPFAEVGDHAGFQRAVHHLIDKGEPGE